MNRLGGSRRNLTKSFLSRFFSSEAPSTNPPSPPVLTRIYDPKAGGPKLGALKSAKVQLMKGEKVWWCSCGLSSTQPFCDGKHDEDCANCDSVKPGMYKPVEFEAPETKVYSFCLCKYSSKKPLCDGEHRKFAGYVPPVKK